MSSTNHPSHTPHQYAALVVFAAQGPMATALRELSALKASRKVELLEGTVWRVLASKEGADLMFVLRDDENAMLLCSVHAEITKALPDAVRVGNWLSLQHVTCCVSPTVFAVVTAANVARVRVCVP